MRVIVTRPEAEAHRWIEGLARRGIEALALPLIAIALPLDTGPLHAAWRALATHRAVMFVSGNAVRGFFAHAHGCDWPSNVRAWAPGPGTRDALRDAGVPAAAIDSPPDDAAQFDSEQLWPRVEAQVAAGDRVLLVRGADAGGQPQGRDWLARQLAGRGVDVSAIAAYARLRPVWTSAQADLAATAASDGSLWLFSSSEAVGNLAELLPRQQWDAARAIATHPRIAQAARALGFGAVMASRPGLADVAASIESAR